MPCALDARDDSFLRAECARRVFECREVNFLQPFNQRNFALPRVCAFQSLLEIVKFALGKGCVLRFQ